MLNVGLYRSKYDRWIMGVCGGLARQFGWNATVTRVITMILAIIVPGVSLLAVALVYVALGILLPESDTY